MLDSRVAIAAVLSISSQLLLSNPAASQQYPSHPIRILSGYAAGGSADTAARLFAQRLQKALGQTVIVENRTGAGTQIATEATVKADPDGYTLQMATMDLTILPAIKKTPPWSVADNFTVIGRVATTPLVYATIPSVPVKNFPEFVSYAKARPNGLNYGSGGIGTLLHMFAELMQVKSQIKLTHVPYKGSAPMMQDLLGGRIEVGVLGPVDVVGREKELNVLVQTGPTRHPAIPAVPTVHEIGRPDMQAIATFTLIGPAKLPPDVVERLTREMKAMKDDDEFRQQLLKVGLLSDIIVGSEVRQALIDDVKQWTEVVQAAGVSLTD